MGQDVQGLYGEHHQTSNHLAVGAGVDREDTCFSAPLGGARIRGVKIITDADVAANGTNFKTFNILNKGADGAQTDVVATRATDTPSDDDLDEHLAYDIPVTGATADLLLLEGEALTIQYVTDASGVAMPQHMVVVLYDAGTEAKPA